MPASILVVEDERDLCATIQHVLTREGFHARGVDTGAAALAAVHADPRPDLVLLDLTLPDRSGIAVCQALRADPRTADLPIVMISARVDEADRIAGLEVGADDYIPKPFSLRELVLRVRAVLRRRAAAPGEPGRLDCGRVSVDAHGYRAWLDGHELPLTALELRLLVALVGHAGRVRSREALLADVWGAEADVTARSVDTLVLHLRDKLGPAAGQLQTMRSVGYRFRPEVDD
jgi:two-component system phosphate regulon response regulator PhoB